MTIAATCQQCGCITCICEPKRLWVLRDHTGHVIDVFDNDAPPHTMNRDDVEYTRADLCISCDDPALLSVVEALRNAIDAIDAAYDGPDDDGAYSTRERAALAKITERLGRG